MKKFTLAFIMLMTSTITAFCGGLSSNLLFTAQLNGAQETPSVTTAAMGVATFTLNASRDTLCFSATGAGLSGAITAAHIHKGALGVSGGVVVDLSGYISGNNLKGTITGATLTASLISDLLNGNDYINFHTTANPNGEIRGQIMLESDISFSAWLNAAQEIPTPTVTGTPYGLAVFNLHPNDSVLTVNAVFSGLSGSISSAHLHYGAVGIAGGVAVTLTSGVNGNVLQYKVNPGAFLDSLYAGHIYINVHTAANPNGEIRGQLVMNKGLVFDSWLTGAQETPATTSPAQSVALLWVSPTLDSIKYSVVSTGLTSTPSAAHLHAGAAGVSGGVLVNLSNSISGNSIQGTATGSSVNTALINAMLQGDIYINIHTTANPNGEVRGQTMKYAREGLTYYIDAAQETSGSTSSATGNGFVSIDRSYDNAHYAFLINGLTGTVSAAHFHKAVAGVSGGVVYTIPTLVSVGSIAGAAGYWTSTDAVTPFTSMYANEFLSDSLYMNAHTAANPNGEVRGQVDQGAACFETTTGINEVPVNVNDVTVYPNPTNGNTTLNFSSAVNKNAQLNIIDIQGRVLTTQNISVVNGINRFNINTENLAQGMYFIQVSAQGKPGTFIKFIKD